MRQKILLVDDTAQVRRMLQTSLAHFGYEIVSAASVAEAVNHIVTQHFDILISDLHMPDPGDGFAVVTAMRHAQPEALTLVISGFPDMKEAMAAVLLQADAVVTKPFDVKDLVELIDRKTQEPRGSQPPQKESVASILERDQSVTIQRWLLRVAKVRHLASLSLTNNERTEHLSEMLKDISARLRKTRTIEEDVAHSSPAAVAHGQARYRQGYTAPSIVEESRILELCIFETIQRNLGRVDFSQVLPDIMLIADEVDAQLGQSVDSFLKMQRDGAAA